MRGAEFSSLHVDAMSLAKLLCKQTFNSRFIIQQLKIRSRVEEEKLIREIKIP